MRALAVLLVACGATSQPPASIANTAMAPVDAAPAGEACQQIQGYIIDGASRRPLAEVQVMSGPEEDFRMTKTDATGRFVLPYRAHASLTVNTSDGTFDELAIDPKACDLGSVVVELEQF